MGTTRHDHGHHHPVIRKRARRWVWSCACGGCSSRILAQPAPVPDWHSAVVGALLHSATAA